MRTSRKNAHCCAWWRCRRQQLLAFQQCEFCLYHKMPIRLVLELRAIISTTKLSYWQHLVLGALLSHHQHHYHSYQTLPPQAIILINSTLDFVYDTHTHTYLKSAHCEHPFTLDGLKEHCYILIAQSKAQVKVE